MKQILIVVCSLICRYTLEHYIANDMYSDQAVPLGLVSSGSIVFASKMKLVWISFRVILHINLMNEIWVSL